MYLRHWTIPYVLMLSYHMLHFNLQYRPILYCSILTHSFTLYIREHIKEENITCTYHTFAALYFLPPPFPLSPHPSQIQTHFLRFNIFIFTLSYHLNNKEIKKCYTLFCMITYYIMYYATLLIFSNINENNSYLHLFISTIDGISKPKVQRSFSVFGRVSRKAVNSRLFPSFFPSFLFLHLIPSFFF